MRKLPPGQKLFDAFAELDVADQAVVLEKLQEYHRFSVKRDKRAKPKEDAHDAPLLATQSVTSDIKCDDCGVIESEHAGKDHEFRWVPF